MPLVGVLKLCYPIHLIVTTEITITISDITEVYDNGVYNFHQKITRVSYIHFQFLFNILQRWRQFYSFENINP